MFAGCTTTHVNAETDENFMGEINFQKNGNNVWLAKRFICNFEDIWI